MSDAADRAPALLPAADRALVRTVDGLDDEAWAAPSLLPGWTRAHVLAHLALNAEGLAGVLDGARRGRPQPMYASAEARDGDIEDLAAAGPAELRDRFLASTTRFEDALAAMRDGDWTGRFERTPGGPEFALANVVLMRVREVEVHHADLDAGYAAEDWPEGFRTLLLDSMTRRSYPAPFVVRPTDLDGTWAYGEGGGGPVVTGPSAAAGWWLTGRGAGEGLTSDTTELPEVEAW
ncbi:maleylpyruvate isomerase family mycothiol-dependent enzyme [Nocardioides flavus (ex Wang et al. 2016)]|uniref:maleylpyruvate isomerase family mycothiol-dependent enzyme n=1 Tax=Nocardioides flavus (ex Wang et al. 2016) TaxID=2058780 RepID=UPI001E352147|nr:maleylpyruvate isomerase family mycothiol-dependent enzyme [Nocardioides flavus (ex Wang et al. 2016)]